MLLLLGRFEEGWPAYETRWDAPAMTSRIRIITCSIWPAWRAAVLVGKSKGGATSSSSCATSARSPARGARIRLSVYKDLIPLAREMPEVERVLGPDEEEAEYDLLTSMLSLPLAFPTTIATIPAEVPYLRAPASRIGRMTPPSRAGVGAADRACMVGLARQPPRSAMPSGAAGAIIAPTRMSNSIACKRRSWPRTEPGWTDRRRYHAWAMLRDFGDTAALIEAMDLVISIDTAVAHLAGALAKPVWIMLPFNPTGAGYWAGTTVPGIPRRGCSASQPTETGLAWCARWLSLSPSDRTVTPARHRPLSQAAGFRKVGAQRGIESGPPSDSRRASPISPVLHGVALCTDCRCRFSIFMCKPQSRQIR